MLLSMADAGVKLENLSTGLGAVDFEMLIVPTDELELPHLADT